ncbi:hypothetical protein [Caballeronia mineralivorans]|uniref:hypothetical protein n=1 Tax=Caballeronia mineralivorans TaxID=2010198 RepID=UPI00069D2CA0|nr:hypothetical protein [Caballeronia mineralivorans]
MTRYPGARRRFARSLAGSAILAGALTVSGCVTQQVLSYQASVANQMTLARLPPEARYRVTTGADPSDVQTSVRAIRFSAPGSGSWSSYLNEAIRTELSTSGNYDASATATLEATLLEVHVTDGKAELAAHFVVRRDQTVRYDKLLRVNTQWDSEFLGVLAASNGLNHTTAIFQDLLRKLFEDPDFVKAT